MTYPQAQSYLNSFVNYERLNFYPYKSSFKLDRVKRLLRLLGNPHRRLRAVHIAGSKGKGSTCAFVGGILREAGFKVGLYTSPHLVDVRERIRILQPAPRHKRSGPGKTEKEIILKKDFTRLIERIMPYAEKLREAKLGGLSYYEILTALAFLYFKEEECGFVVLETGIGGRLDATNVVCSLVCAITPISYEHTAVLGATLEKIAAEKAGIIKFTMLSSSQLTVRTRESKSQIVITAPQRPSALRVIRKRAKEVGADLYEVGKDIQIKERGFGLRGQSFDVQGIFDKYSGLKIGLLGEHQIVNAAVAVACVESLRNYGTGITQQAIREGLKKVQWPGRLQMISQKPKIILDAAHNRASACALKDALNKFFKFHNLILVFGASQDKDVRGILRELTPLAARIILTKTQNPRALAPEIIKTFIKARGKEVVLTDNPNKALKIAKQKARQQDLILVCGSLFLIGEVLKSRGRRKNLFLA